MYERVIVICGMPRSGTSWVGQIFDSVPDVAFRMEPLFSYRFKNVVNGDSSCVEIAKFLTDVFLANDDFINQKENRDKGAYSSFVKNKNQSILVVKTTRHHHLLRKYLDCVKNIEIVSVIRNPCAVINSWINTEREFLKKGCVIDEDWRSGECRKNVEGEFWGFDDWLSVTKQHVELSEKRINFNFLKYSDLVRDPQETIKNLFKKLSIPYGLQTEEFLVSCHSLHDDDPYSVFKSRDVENQWKTKLDSSISNEIIDRTVAAGLEQFI